jgi:hypothetical protein
MWGYEMEHEPFKIVVTKAVLCLKSVEELNHTERELALLPVKILPGLAPSRTAFLIAKQLALHCMERRRWQAVSDGAKCSGDTETQVQ